MYTYALKISRKICSKIAHFSNQSEFRKKSNGKKSTPPAFCFLGLIILTLLISITSTFANDCVSTQLTLEECVQRAKIHSHALNIAQFEIQSAIADKNRVRSAFFPRVDAEGVVDNSNRAVSDELTQFQKFKPNRAAGIKAAVGLWDFGVNWKRFKASKLLINASEMEKEKVCLNVEEEVRVAYIQILETEKMVNVLEASIQTLSHELTHAIDRQNQGLLKQTEVLAIEVQLTEQKKNLLQLQNTLTTQKMALNRLIGFPLNSCIYLVDIECEPPCVDYEEALQFALCRRPDFRAYQKQLEALFLNRNADYWSVTPRMYAFANGNYGSTSKSSVSVGIGITMPLFRGGEKFADIQKIDAEIGKLQSLIAEANELAILEIKSLFLEFDEIHSSFLLSEKVIALSQQQFCDTRELYTQDLVSIQDVLWAQDALNQAQVNYFSQFYRWHQAFARLYTATGGYPQKPL